MSHAHGVRPWHPSKEEIMTAKHWADNDEWMDDAEDCWGEDEDCWGDDDS